MPLCALHERLKLYVAPNTMTQVTNEYEKYTRQLITRQEFIQTVRGTVNDSLLKDVIRAWKSELHEPVSMEEYAKLLTDVPSEPFWTYEQTLKYLVE